MYIVYVHLRKKHRICFVIYLFPQKLYKYYIFTIFARDRKSVFDKKGGGIKDFDKLKSRIHDIIL